MFDGEAIIESHPRVRRAESGGAARPARAGEEASLGVRAESGWLRPCASQRALERLLQPLARLRADKSGFDNLFLCGDWTRNGLNAGAAESAVMSGVICANVILGDPSPIEGEADVLG